MYQVNIINNSDSNKTNTTYTVNSRDNVILIDDQPFEWDLVEIKKNYFHIIKDNKSHIAEIIHTNREEKQVTLKIDGHKFNLKLKDKFDLLLEKLGMDQNSANQLLEIKAPMPGLILNIHVEEGQEVKRDEPIMILEAMKMENIIKSPGEGIVKKINVGIGDSVDKNSILVQF
ncbi:biotin/lipoyl-containing protein [Fulvivirgaceae bacterium BMA12]|uniref:Biotin/lipoyl-containing protein n=1 Tax=Agaribacillus aureus TaxID=3051825 RepID=A0ABT8L814_9BACT|nr:biotin/lipoyl-containing protein [Fulvivirgaceae bacterium BMA12]